MATGIPVRKERTMGLSYQLEYEGKKPIQDILNIPPTCCKKVFTVNHSDDEWMNRLYFGNNLGILSSFLKDKEICGKVRLVYIDPPFATNSKFKSRNLTDAYTDFLTGAEYIEFIRERLILIRELLSDDGSIYVHLDSNMIFEIKFIMDEIFGSNKFKNFIVRQKCNRKNYTRLAYGNIADYILFYTKSDNYVWNRPYEPWTEEAMIREYPCIDEATGRRYKKVPVHAPGTRKGETGQEWRGMLPPPGKHWQYKPSILDEFDKKGEIYWSPNGNPRRKVFFDNSQGIPVQDIWLEFKDAHNQNTKITGYPTEKNINLLDRIIQASSNPGDLVLDCFAGSGTTLVSAENNKRRWIGIDSSLVAIETTIKRLAKGSEPMGDFVSQRLKESKQEVATQEAVFEQILNSNFELYSENLDDIEHYVKKWKSYFGK